MEVWLSRGRFGWLMPVTVLLSGVILVLSVLPRFEIVRSQAAEVEWLRHHSTTNAYIVTELGLGRRDGTVESVIVAVPGHFDAFVDLRHSTQMVRREGDTVQARVAHRIPDAVGYGVGADAVDHRFILEYLVAGSPVLLALTLWAGAAWVGRREHG